MGTKRAEDSRVADFLQQAAANAVGSLAAALAFFLGATFLGVLDDVPTHAVASAVALLAVGSLGLFAAWQTWATGAAVFAYRRLWSVRRESQQIRRQLDEATTHYSAELERLKHMDLVLETYQGLLTKALDDDAPLTRARADELAKHLAEIKQSIPAWQGQLVVAHADLTRLAARATDVFDRQDRAHDAVDRSLDRWPMRVSTLLGDLLLGPAGTSA